MRKLIFTAICFILILGCAGRKVKTFKKSAEISENKETKITTVVRKDSISKKDTEEANSVFTNSSKNYWKYTAPALSPIFKDTLFLKSPFWLVVNGDSIDVSGMPVGSTLESGYENTEKTEYFKKLISELNAKNSSLEEQLAQKSDKKAKVVENIREVENKSIQWLLVASALLIGIFIKPIANGFIKLVKLII